MVWVTVAQGNMHMTKLAVAVLLMALLASAAHAQTNAGEQKAAPSLPFNVTKVASFDLPWRIAFLPDGRMLVTEKVGRVDLVTPQGAKTELGGVPPSYYEGQNGMLGVFLSPRYATDHNVYLTYVEPGAYGGGVALGRENSCWTASPGCKASRCCGARCPRARAGNPEARSHSHRTANTSSSRWATASASRPRRTPASPQARSCG
jgi:hypothetical protein